MSKENEIPSGIYADIDTLFDTRLATLALIHENVALEALRSGYHIRDFDEFPNVNHADFKELYATRDPEVLFNSPVTKIPDMIRDAIKGMFKQTLETPFATKITLDINFYPYVVTEQVAASLINTFKEMTIGVADIRAVWIPPEKLSAKYCAEKYSLMIKYDYSEWIDHLAKTDELKRNPLTIVTLYCPRLYFVKRPTKQLEIKLRMQNQDLFLNTEKMFSPLINLKLLTIDYFCASLGEGVEDAIILDLLKKKAA
jgi:hypothetical protein